jgi:hypothetical protein
MGWAKAGTMDDSACRKSLNADEDDEELQRRVEVDVEVDVDGPE